MPVISRPKPVGKHLFDDKSVDTATLTYAPQKFWAENGASMVIPCANLHPLIARTCVSATCACRPPVQRPTVRRTARCRRRDARHLFEDRDFGPRDHNDLKYPLISTLECETGVQSQRSPGQVRYFPHPRASRLNGKPATEPAYQ